MIPSFGITIVKSLVNLTTHSKCLNVVVEPVTGYSEHISIAKSYGVLKPRRGKIDVSLRNHSVKQITLPKQTFVGEIPRAKIIPALLVPNPTGHRAGEKEATAEKRKPESQKELLDKIDLTGLGEWSQNEQKETWELITEYAGIFAMSDMDLGKTSLVKHSIRLTDNTKFQDHYQQIPPSMYEEVREHLKEMLEICDIWPSHSPWASQSCWYVRRMINSNFALIWEN